MAVDLSAYTSSASTYGDGSTQTTSGTANLATVITLPPAAKVISLRFVGYAGWFSTDSTLADGASGAAKHRMPVDADTTTSFAVQGMKEIRIGSGTVSVPYHILIEQ